VYGPLVKALALKTLREAAESVSIPLIACGGVHSFEDVNELLAAGASAVMVDSLAWIDPKAVNAMLHG
jgi:dihydroorotate dehydrogenase (NAD+) catalytic subunit